MAEFCKKCFVKMNKGSVKEEQLEMSKDNDFCESCGEVKPVVIGILPDTKESK